MGWGAAKVAPNQASGSSGAAAKRRPKAQSPVVVVLSSLDDRLVAVCSRSSSAPPAPRAFGFVSAPADTFANTFSQHTFPPASKGERVPSFVSSRAFPSLHVSPPRQKANTFLPWSLSRAPPSLVLPESSPARKHTYTRPNSLTHPQSMPPSIVRRVDRGHVLLSDGWVARAPAPLWPPRRSLRGNGLNNQAEQAVTDAAGSGVQIKF